MLSLRSGIAAGLAALMFGLCAAQSALAQGQPGLTYQPGTAVSSAVASVRPAVVAVETRFKEPVLKDEYAYWAAFRGARPLYGLWGTGFVYEDPQYVVTTSFLMKDAEYIRVVVEDGRSFKAELVGQNEDLDVAVLKVDWGPQTQVPTPAFGNSDALKLGQPIAIVGKALNSVDTYSSFGVISAIRKEVPGTDKPTDAYLQFDASYELSFTGGPMVDVGGNVVGMVSGTVQDYSLTNINLAVPVNDVMSAAQKIIAGTNESLAMGLELLEVTSGLKENGAIPYRFDWNTDGTEEDLDFGLFVTYVYPGQGSDIAGLKAGDVIIEMDGQRMKYRYDYDRFKRGLSYGQLVKISYITRGADGKWSRAETQVQVLIAKDDDTKDAEKKEQERVRKDRGYQP